MRKTKRQTGITLVALVITIIILLILAGITISSLTNTGLFKQAQNAKNITQEKTVEEKATLDNYEEQIGIASGAKEYIAAQTIEEAQTDDMLGKKINSVITDAYGNKITVPAGFKITNDATTVTQGIVVIDSDENEFVWVPVGKIYTDTQKTEANAKNIELGRYEFDSNGNKSVYSGSYIEENQEDTNTTLKNWGNTIAKSITKFKNSVEINGGYYIGRYEARKNSDKAITEKGTDQVYNYVTQLQAANQAQNMYNSNKFTSDLINSYAWDTATLFLQTCGTNKKYSRQNSLNTEVVAQTGTNVFSEDIKIDKQCNIYDMASNIYEFTTETSNDSEYPCVYRGGDCFFSRDYTSGRNYLIDSYGDGNLGFRPILYINV